MIFENINIKIKWYKWKLWDESHRLIWHKQIKSSMLLWLRCQTLRLSIMHCLLLMCNLGSSWRWRKSPVVLQHACVCFAHSLCSYTYTCLQIFAAVSHAVPAVVNWGLFGLLWSAGSPPLIYSLLHPLSNMMPVKTVRLL